MTIPSPCIRNCCLDNHDCCLGCLRTLDEILIWGNASDEEKQAILARCDKRRALSKPTHLSTPSGE